MAVGVTALGPEVTLSEGLNPRGIGVGGSEAASSCGLFGTGLVELSALSGIARKATLGQFVK